MSRFTLPALASLVVLAAPVGAQATHAAAKTQSAAAKTASGAAWRTAYSDDTVTVSIAPAKIQKRADGTYAVRLKWVYAGDQSIGHGKSYRTMVETRYINCKTLGTKAVKGETFDAGDKSVSSYAMSASDLEMLGWSKRKAGTSSEKAYEGVCRAIKGK